MAAGLLSQEHDVWTSRHFRMPFTEKRLGEEQETVIWLRPYAG